jgi:hypothetical protein
MFDKIPPGAVLQQHQLLVSLHIQRSQGGHVML